MVQQPVDASSRRERLTVGSEELFRQVHPKMIDKGVPGSGAFVPSEKDEGQLSVARSSITTAQRAHEHHTQALQLESAGTWGLLVEEIERAGLTAFADPIEADSDNGVIADPAHSYVEFGALAGKARRRVGLLLKGFAIARGRRYPTEDSAAGS